MDKMPKRRKYKDNPYELNKNSITNKYYIKFKDSMNKEQLVEVDATIYKVFDDSELNDISEMNEYDNHIEHSEIYEYKIDLISSRRSKSIEELIEDKMLHEDLKKAIQQLSEVQRRRVKKYYFEGKNINQIANEELCSKVAIKYSIDIAIQKLKEILKK